jgi:hypothetical protein
MSQSHEETPFLLTGIEHERAELMRRGFVNFAAGEAVTVLVRLQTFSPNWLKLRTPEKLPSDVATPVTTALQLWRAEASGTDRL